MVPMLTFFITFFKFTYKLLHIQIKFKVSKVYDVSVQVLSTITNHYKEQSLNSYNREQLSLASDWIDFFFL